MFTILFRMGSLFVAIIYMFYRFRGYRESDRPTVLTSSSLSALLLFPGLVMVWEPALSARANWLQIQHENLTWAGGDLLTNLEYSRESWKDRVYLVDTPRLIDLVRVPDSVPEVFQLSRLSTWFETFGYSNRFCQFVGLGWFASLLGMLILILNSCLPDGRLDRRRTMRAMMGGVATLVAGLVGVATPVVIAAHQLEQARGATMRGFYLQAQEYLDRAVWILPALAHETSFVAQNGLLDFRLGMEGKPTGRLFRANLLERRGRDTQAMDVYHELIASTPKDSAVHREALRAVLRSGIVALNAGQLDIAIDRLEDVLRAEPCSPKANYAILLAYLRTNQRENLERSVRRIEAVYAYFRLPTKRIVLASCHEVEMFAALRSGEMDDVFRSSIRAKNP